VVPVGAGSGTTTATTANHRLQPVWLAFAMTGPSLVGALSL